eukprot:1475338-Ditylum_brightwellii.AAC.1
MEVGCWCCWCTALWLVCLVGDNSRSVVKSVRVRGASCACWSGPWRLCLGTLFGSPHCPRQGDIT